MDHQKFVIEQNEKERFVLQVWAEPGLRDKLAAVEGVAYVSVSAEIPNNYYLNLDHRYVATQVRGAVQAVLEGKHAAD
jgi:hypothetical protein